MKAARFYGIHDLRIEEVPEPKYDPEHGLLVHIAATAVCGTDIRVFNHGHTRITRPLIIGHEIAGTVAAVGRQVQGWGVGDRVAVAPPAIVCGECPECRVGAINMCRNRISMGYELDGGFAEYVAVSPKGLAQGHLLPIPDDVSLERAALTEPLACCLNGQRPLRIGAGDRVAVVGAGAIGLMHGQLARAAGAEQVYIADLSPHRVEMAHRFNFDGCICSAQEDPVAAVQRLTGKEGATVVIVACSSGRAQEQAVFMAGRQGRVSFFAGLPKDQPTIALDTNRIHYQEITIYGANSSTLQNNQDALWAISTGAVDAERLVTHLFPLEQTEQGIRTAISGESLKVVIKP